MSTGEASLSPLFSHNKSVVCMYVCMLRKGQVKPKALRHCYLLYPMVLPKAQKKNLKPKRYRNFPMKWENSQYRRATLR